MPLPCLLLSLLELVRASSTQPLSLSPLVLLAAPTLLCPPPLSSVVNSHPPNPMVGGGGGCGVEQSVSSLTHCSHTGTIKQGLVSAVACVVEKCGCCCVVAVCDCERGQPVSTGCCVIVSGQQCPPVVVLRVCVWL
eukprot:m.55555 g.55555  ORF g.55555 m.55555 type:complete len:136 (-) comp12538_c0_seq1:283-690(-)